MPTSKLAALGCAAALATLAAGPTGAVAQSAAPAASYKPYVLSDMGADRPLTVKRRAVREPVTAVPVQPSPLAGPGAIVAVPARMAGALVALPFKVLGGLFPADGALATTPLVLVGAPIQAAGQIAQFPFHLVDAAFTGSPALPPVD